MSDGTSDDTDKTHDPTPQKLKKAREKGELAKSTDLSVAAGYAGLILAALAFGSQSTRLLGSELTVLLDQPDRISSLVFSGSPQAAFGPILSGVLGAVTPWFAIPSVAVFLSIVAQKGLVIAPSKLRPKLSRINILKNAKNKYGLPGLIEFAKSASKLTLYSLCLGLFLKEKLPEIVGSIETSPGYSVVLLARLCIEFLLIVLIIAVLMGVFDTIWQIKEHLRKNRMSHKEIKDEVKESEGDPYIKQQRRFRAQQIAMNQMVAKVPGADVVIVNPTHFAVCLKWNREPGTAPVCIAKGVDGMAAVIREAATLSGVPIHHDPPTARALYSTAKLDQEIPQEHYRAVAASIRFAEKMRIRAKGSVI